MPQRTVLAVMDRPSVLAFIAEIAAIAAQHHVPPDAVAAVVRATVGLCKRASPQMALTNEDVESICAAIRERIPQ